MGGSLMLESARAIGRIGRGAGVAMAALLLAACAQTELAIHAAKQINEKAGEPSAKRIGDYKVGSPYQINGVWYYPKEDYEYTETGVASWYGPQFHGKATANGETFDMNELTAAHRTLQMPAVVRVTNLENGRSILLRVNDRGPFARNRVIDISRRGAQLLGFMEKGTAMVKIDLMADESRQVAMEAQRRIQIASLPANARKPVTAEPLIGSARVETQTASASVSEAKSAQPGTPQGAPQASAGRRASPVPQAKPPAPPSRLAAKAASQPVPPQPAPPPPVELAEKPTMPSGEVRQVALRGEPRMYVQVGAFLDRTKADRLRTELASLGPSHVSQTQASGQRFFRVRLGPVETVEQADRVLDAVIDAGHATARVVVD